MTDVEKLSEFAMKASDIVHEKKLDDFSPMDKMIAFPDPAAPKETLGLVFHEDIEALAKEMGIDYQIISRDDITSMRISKLTLHELEKIKEHPREPLESTVLRMISFWNNHSDCEDMKKPMTQELKDFISVGLEHKFHAKVTEIEDADEGTIFHVEGDPKGTPVLIPKR